MTSNLSRSKRRIYPNPELLTYQFNVNEPFHIKEKDITRSWFNLTVGKSYRTTNKGSFLIIDHGQMNTNKGPDIKNANLFLNGKYVLGDIECHIRENDWFTHGHETDPNYANVILHVIHKPASRPSPLNNTFIIHPNADFKCSLNSKNIRNGFEDHLRFLAQKRWQSKVELMMKKDHLEKLSIPFGAGGNENGFKRLINRINVETLKKLHEVEQNKYLENAADNIQWEHCGIRPAQWPEQRLQLLGETILFIDSISKDDLKDPLAIMNRFNRICKNGGKGIKTEICINYLFPWLAAIALRFNDLSQFTFWKDAWMELKLLSPYGCLKKKYGSFLSRKELCTVGIAQGLLYLEKEYCDHRYCTVCPLKMKSSIFYD